MIEAPRSRAAILDALQNASLTAHVQSERERLAQLYVRAVIQNVLTQIACERKNR